MPDRPVGECFRTRGVERHLAQYGVTWRGLDHPPFSLDPSEPSPLSRLTAYIGSRRRNRQPSAQVARGSDAFERQRRALADADAHGGEGRSPPRRLSSIARVRRGGRLTCRADGRARWLRREDDVFGVVIEGEAAQAGSAWEANASLRSTTSKSRGVSSAARRASDRRHRPDADDAGATPPEATPGYGRRPRPLFAASRRRQQRRRAVVDAGGVAGGHAAASRTMPPSLASASSVVSARGCSSVRRGLLFPCGP